MRKTIIVANWKMNPGTSDEAQQLFETVGKGVNETHSVEVVICPPFVFIPEIVRAASSVAFGVGGQDCFWEAQGAYTGEISAAMLKNLGCSYVILGHSERKNYLGETYGMINKKVKAVLQSGLIPVVCIGEKERQGQNGNKEELERQMREVLKEIPRELAKNLVLCYEPEWAISSNKGAAAAAPEDCAKALASMREVAKEMFGDFTVPILYGGSTNSANIKGFIESGAQGVLVGSSSLNAEEFARLVRNAAME
ncbi:MAG: triose-phosphate isomerase [Patescibacteria group bacterium]